MLNPIEPALNLYEAQLQASKDLVNAALSSVQRLDQLVLQAAKEGLCDQITYAQSAVGIRDLSGVTALGKAFAQPNQQRVLSFCRDLLKELSGAYVEMATIMQSQIKDMGTNVSSIAEDVETATRSPTPALPTDAMFQFWNDAWRQWNAMADQYLHTVETASRVEQDAATAETVAASETPSARPSRAKNRPGPSM